MNSFKFVNLYFKIKEYQGLLKFEGIHLKSQLREITFL